MCSYSFKWLIWSVVLLLSFMECIQTADTNLENTVQELKTIVWNLAIKEERHTTRILALETANIKLKTQLEKISQCACQPAKSTTLTTSRKLPKSCYEAGTTGVNIDNPIEIDVDGESGPLLKMKVKCEGTTVKGVYKTIMETVKTKKLELKNYEAAFSQRIDFTYDGPKDSINAVIDLSRYCQQYIRYDCKHVDISDYAKWVTRDGKRAEYFAGSNPDYKGCACGISSSCSSKDKKCNCDKPDVNWNYDLGFVSYKSHLPVRAILAGDTGQDFEQAFFTLGPVVCFSPAWLSLTLGSTNGTRGKAMCHENERNKAVPGKIYFHEMTFQNGESQYVPLNQAELPQEDYELNRKAYQKSCSEAASIGLDLYKPLEIDIDGESGPLPKIKVKCERNNGVVKTIMETVGSQNVKINDKEDPFSHKVQIKYVEDMKSIIAVIDASKYCQQYIRFDCKHVEVVNYAGWLTRDGTRVEYLAGNKPDYKGCACGLTKSCHNVKNCNCEMNDETWRYDEGYVSYKKHLPIKTFLSGDTGNTNEEAKVTIGPVMCWSGSQALPKSCLEAASNGVNLNGPIEIDVDGESGPLLKMKVKCEGTTVNGVYKTIMETVGAQKVLIDGNEAAFSKKVQIRYVGDMKSIIAVIDASKSCQQYIRFECYNALVNKHAGWTTRDGTRAQYLAGSKTDYVGCACGLTKTCFKKEKNCNCDANDDKWRFDDGYVSYKKHLPIKTFLAGDTGSAIEKAKVSIGAVLCLN